MKTKLNISSLSVNFMYNGYSETHTFSCPDYLVNATLLYWDKRIVDTYLKKFKYKKDLTKELNRLNSNKTKMLKAIKEVLCTKNIITITLD